MEGEKEGRPSALPVYHLYPWGAAPLSQLAVLEQIQATVPSPRTQPPTCHAVGTEQHRGTHTGKCQSGPSPPQAHPCPRCIGWCWQDPVMSLGSAQYCGELNINGVIRRPWQGVAPTHRDTGTWRHRVPRSTPGMD